MTVYLREPTQDDAKNYIKAMQRSIKLHQAWVSPAKSLPDYRIYLEHYQKPNQQAYLLMSSNHEIAGVFHLSEIVRGCFKNAYLGFFAVHGFDNQGLMSAGLKLVLNKAFNELDLHRLEANIQPDNQPSINLVKANHFKHEGFSPSYLFIDGRWRDHERFAIIK